MDYLCVRTVTKRDPKNRDATELFTKGKIYRSIGKDTFIAEDNKLVALPDDFIESYFIKTNPSEIEMEVTE